MKELTLEELIEKCGEGFTVLVRVDSVWLASSGANDNEFGSITPPKYEGAGKTPKEAVQNLLKELEK